MKASGSIALCVLAVASCVLASNATAADRKVNHAMACVPLSPQTTYADLYYRPVGLKNITNSTEYVVCPVLVDVDSVDNWTATSGQTGSVTITYQAPNGGTANCEVSVSTNLDGTKATFSDSAVFSAGQVGNVTISGIHADTVVAGFMAWHPVSLYCTMPPESSILRVMVNELVVDTDDGSL